MRAMIILRRWLHLPTLIHVQPRQRFMQQTDLFGKSDVGTANKQAKPRCARCNRLVDKIDPEHGQCARCNGEWLHEVARWALIDSLPADQARHYMLDGDH